MINTLPQVKSPLSESFDALLSFRFHFPSRSPPTCYAMSTGLAFSAPLSLATTRSHGKIAVSSLTPLRTFPNAHPKNVAPPPSLCRMAFTSIGGLLTPPPTSLPEHIPTVIRALYIQVLGNAYIMDSEREELCVAESEFAMYGDVREFVRSIALSHNYKERFFNSVSQYRSVELAFKHLLGRAPESAAEYASAMAIYHEKGYESFVSWFVDSLEYEENFGAQIVPYGIYKGCYSSNELFNRSVALRLAPGCSDKGRSSMLQYCVLSGDSPNWLSISKALPVGTEKGTGFCIGSYWQSTQRNKNAPVRVGTKVPGGVVFY